MDREIILSSYSVKNIPGNKPENFTTKFTRPIILNSNNEHILGLNRVIDMSFTCFNANPSYNNQKIAYSLNDGVSYIYLTFPAGVWSYNEFNSYI